MESNVIFPLDVQNLSLICTTFKVIETQDVIEYVNISMCHVGYGFAYTVVVVKMFVKQ